MYCDHDTGFLTTLLMFGSRAGADIAALWCPVGGICFVVPWRPSCCRQCLRWFERTGLIAKLYLERHQGTSVPFRCSNCGRSLVCIHAARFRLTRYRGPGRVLDGDYFGTEYVRSFRTLSGCSQHERRVHPVLGNVWCWHTMFGGAHYASKGTRCF